MHLNGFDLELPIPKLRKPHAFVTLRPWIDVGSVGRLAFRTLERHFEARDLAKLSRPGVFFDFTRYRPNIYTLDGKREVTVPNVNVRYATGPGENDFIFLHLLEPHLNGETYVKCVVQLLKHLEIERYCLLGSMYDLVPHTKPILVTGSSNNEETSDLVKTYGVNSSNYEGPTSIITTINQYLNKVGIETMGLIAHLPQYAQTEVNHAGRLRLLNIICELYGFSMDLGRIALRAKQQNDELSTAMAQSPEVKALVEQLELQYDKRLNKEEDNDYDLSPEIEDFLDEMGNQFSQN
ncbi:MAG: PAC2 family protein [SAR202 cluster bacterium]|nr:PAC2 family protein [SAR202 cluster bacterium]|tara:strand:+ start:1477 stop:2358 length:882 start_codon:yes stop_codon:yes gene_type:complete